MYVSVCVYAQGGCMCVCRVSRQGGGCRLHTGCSATGSCRRRLVHLFFRWGRMVQAAARALMALMPSATPSSSLRCWLASWLTDKCSPTISKLVSTPESIFHSKYSFTQNYLLFLYIFYQQGNYKNCFYSKCETYVQRNIPIY